MELNGVRTYTELLIPLTDETAAFYDRQLLERQLAVFGADRLREAEDALADPAVVDDVKWHIEELCTRIGGTSNKGVYRRYVTVGAGDERHAVQLMWNPSGTVGGFGANMVWDGAVANISSMSFGSEELVPPWLTTPLEATTSEGLYIDQSTGLAMVRRTVEPDSFGSVPISADKPASASEAANLLAWLAHTAVPERSGRRPVFLEVGFGLDPMVERGCRTYIGKTCVEMDPAIGVYENRFGAYGEAVRAQITEFASRADDRQNILYIIADGGHIPLPSGLVQEVFMSNIINAPDLGDQTAEKLLAEARRVLAPRGNLVLRCNWHTDVWPQARLVALLRASGFEVSRSLEHPGESYAAMDEQYGVPSEVAAPKGYYVIAQPSLR